MLAIYVSTNHYYFINHSRMLGEVQLFLVYLVHISPIQTIKSNLVNSVYFGPLQSICIKSVQISVLT